MKITVQSPTEKFWIDEKKIQIPFNRINKIERLKEKLSGKITTIAVRLHKELQDFKTNCVDSCEKAYQEDLKEGKASSIKGGYTLYNFDKSIKIERSVNEAITFDENLIAAAKDKFDEFLKAGTTGVDEMVQELIMSAFSSNKKGKLDSKKVLSLLSYKQRIKENKYPEFHEALKLIEDSIRRPDSKIYFRIWVKDENNEYQNIDLNFSNI